MLPMARSLNLATCLRVNGGGVSSRGSRPGRASAAKMSVTVGSPASSSLAICSASAFAAACCNSAPVQSFKPKPKSFIISSVSL